MSPVFGDRRARAQFEPSALGILINPFFLARRALWRAMEDMAEEARGRMLDVGCGTQPYRRLFAHADEYLGLEIDTTEARERGVADVYYDGGAFPFPAARFDVVLCNQVLEHVFNPDEFLSEIHRVMVPGGRLLVTVPFVWDEHEQPYDFARYSTFGVRAVLERNGFVIVWHRRLLADASVLFQLVNAYAFKVSQSRGSWSRRLIKALVMVPASLLGLAAARVLPSNDDLFLDQALVAERAD